MAELLSRSDFIEVDVTYKASVELEYLLNVVTFNYTTLKCEFIHLWVITCEHMGHLCLGMQLYQIRFCCLSITGHVVARVR